MFEGENLSRRMKKVWKLITNKTVESMFAIHNNLLTGGSLHCTAHENYILHFSFFHVFSASS